MPLLERPQLIALNKVDVPEGRELADMVRPTLEERGYRVFEISAVSREGLRELSFALAELVEADRAAKLLARRAQAAHRHAPARRQRDRVRRARSRAAPTAASTASSAPSPSAGCSRPTSRTTRPSASSPTASRSWASRTSCSRQGAVPGSAVMIGAGDGVVFDWEPTLTSAAELITSPRGTDARLDDNRRPTRKPAPRRVLRAHGCQGRRPRRARAAEREGGIWSDDAGTCNATDDASRTTNDRRAPRFSAAQAHRREGRLVVDQRRQRRPDRPARRCARRGPRARRRGRCWCRRVRSPPASRS